MADNQKHIQDLMAGLGKLDPQSADYKVKVEAINAQIMALQDKERESILKPPVQANMESVDIPASPDDAEHYVRPVGEELEALEGNFIMVSRLKNRPVSETIDLAQEFADSESTEDTIPSIPQLINRAVEQFIEAHNTYNAFTSEHAALIDEQKEKSFARTKLERTIAGLVAKHAQDNARIVTLENGLTELVTRDTDAFPKGVSMSLSYELSPEPESRNKSVINDADLIQWCVQWQQTLLTADEKVIKSLIQDPDVERVLSKIKTALLVDADKADAYFKFLNEEAKGDQTQFRLPVQLPPVEIVAKIQPTVGNVFPEEIKGDSDE